MKVSLLQSDKPYLQRRQVSRIERESHAFQVCLMLSCMAAQISHILEAGRYSVNSGEYFGE